MTPSIDTPEPIHGEEVMPLFLAACPSFEARWAEIRHDETFLDRDGTRLAYVDCGEVARHLVALARAHDTSELPAAFAVIERFYHDGDRRLQNLATIGYLESLQNLLSWQHDVSEADFEMYLGPQTRRWWRGLNALWDGTIPPPVRPLDP